MLKDDVDGNDDSDDDDDEVIDDIEDGANYL